MDVIYNIINGTGTGNGNGNSSNKIRKTPFIGFEDVKQCIARQYKIIHTLPISNENCFIHTTLTCQEEVDYINKILDEDELDTTIIVYGYNHTDDTPKKKQEQLLELGFTHVYVYLGGLFEWLLLQELYGEEHFPTTTKLTDLLIYKPTRKLL